MTGTDAKYTIVLGWHITKRVRDLKLGDVIIQTVNRGMGQIDGRVINITQCGNKARIHLKNVRDFSPYFSEVITTRNLHTVIPIRWNPYDTGGSV